MKRSIWSMPSSDRSRWALTVSAKPSSSAIFWMFSLTEVRGLRISWAIVAAMRPMEASFSCWTSFRLASSVCSRARRSWAVIPLKLRASSPTSSWPEGRAIVWLKSPLAMRTVASTRRWRGRVMRRARIAAPRMPRTNPAAPMSRRTFWISRARAYMGSRDSPILTEPQRLAPWAKAGTSISRIRTGASRSGSLFSSEALSSSAASSARRVVARTSPCARMASFAARGSPERS